MPYETLCQWPGCPNTMDGGRYCDEHRRKNALPKKTDPRYWTTEWRTTKRAIFVRDGYRCQMCNRLIGLEPPHCDHIIPVSQGGGDEEDNLQTLCAGCHNRKTMEEEAGR